jgi:hypothetical protein
LCFLSCRCMYICFKNSKRREWIEPERDILMYFQLEELP